MKPFYQTLVLAIFVALSLSIETFLAVQPALAKRANRLPLGYLTAHLSMTLSALSGIRRQQTFAFRSNDK